jgi:hypothetical protein
MGETKIENFEVPAPVLQDMMAFIEKSSSLLEETGRVQAEMHRRAPALADTLVKAGLLDVKSRDAAISKLQEPLQVMESLQKTAEYVTQSVPSMGAPDTTPQGSEKPASVKESDRAYYARLGFNVA